jgi:hypothetical protein
MTANLRVQEVYRQNLGDVILTVVKERPWGKLMNVT